ncbi:uncharacterized protein LOC118477429 [Aplysia californica]|uniref:Uncharacterized protein LOC118477429 n=1 Tax=Aplysia californica TaxID=6500 RepID=A0ABM1VQR2_APLCA|nr:uncharacterized protein LOC118477429 [Aplysia californica]
MAPQRKLYAQGAMEKAAEAVSKGMSVKGAAQRFGVPRTTLSDKLRDKYPVTPKSKTILSTEEENRLEEWLTVSARRGIGRTNENLCLAVQRFLNSEGRTTVFTDNLPGRTWVRSFFGRRPKLREKTLVLGDKKARVTGDKLRAWFKEVEKNLAEDGVDIKSVDPRCVFNADENAFPLRSTGQVIVTEEGNRHPYLICSDNKRQITVLSCASASGHLLPPTVIFPGQRWSFKPWEDFPEASCVHTFNGWINAAVFKTWLEETFIPAVVDLPRPIVLFCDGHTSHTSLDEVHDLCKEHGILYYLLPVSASHLVQPLDLIFYGILKEEWRKGLRDHMNIAGVEGIFPKTFMPVFKDVWTRTYGEGREEVLVKAFRKSGLSPWDPNAPDYSKCKANRVCEKPAAPVSTSCDVPPSVVCNDDAVCNDDDVPPLVVYDDDTVCDDDVKSNDVPPLVVCFDVVCNDDDVVGDDVSRIGPADTLVHAAEFPPPLVSTPAQDPVGDQDHEYCLPEQALRPLEDETLVTPQAPEILPLDKAFVLDKLIDHVIATRWTAADMYWVRRRQWHNIKPKEKEGAYKKYLDLYNQLIQAPSFDNLPVPACRTPKISTQKRAQAPKYVSGTKYKELEEAKKLEEEKKKERVKERKRKRVKEERKRKRVEKEERKRKMVEKEEEKKKSEEEKRLTKLENQRAGKKKKQE